MIFAALGAVQPRNLHSYAASARSSQPPGGNGGSQLELRGNSPHGVFGKDRPDYWILRE